VTALASVDPALTELGLIVVAGVAASWLAWRLDLPSILFLLIAGIVLGPVTGWVHPDQLLGELLFPVVSFSVGIILFEGGLTLRSVEVEETRGVVRNLVTVGVLVTWLLTAAGAHLIVGLDLGLALLLGAIFTVTGPTVITPLLHHLRPRERVSNVLRWEGILVDPVGAVLAVLVFEVLLAGGLDEAAMTVATIVGRAVAAGAVLGVAGAALLYFVLRRHLAPDLLQSPVTLATVLAVFTASEVVQPESGLVAATVMGAVIANQTDIAKRHIIEFKENLRVLLISFLFVILGARLPASAIEVVTPSSLLLLALLILVIRPVAVILSTIGSKLDRRERAFVAGVAPRGVVAAAISSVFALELAEAGYPGAEQLVPLSFLFIIGTVAVYGLAAGPLGRLLGVVPDHHDGVLLVGAHRWARDLGGELQEAGIPVTVVDTDAHDLARARDRGLETFEGNPVHEGVLVDMDLAGVGHFVALTRYDQGNALAVLHFLEEFDRADAYQLPPSPEDEDDDRTLPKELRGRLLGCDLTWHEIDDLYREGAQFVTVDLAGPDPTIPEDVRPFALVDPASNVTFCTEDRPLDPSPGDVLVGLRHPDP
jgi:NhaP-type Na+/H+ or K+/H+ antiporter